MKKKTMLYGDLVPGDTLYYRTVTDEFESWLVLAVDKTKPQMKISMFPPRRACYTYVALKSSPLHGTEIVEEEWIIDVEINLIGRGVDGLVYSYVMLADREKS